MSPLIAAEGLEVRFRVKRAGWLRAVDGVDLQIYSGETLGLIGESGSGKSTLGRVLACLQQPSAGRVRQDGTDPFALRGAAQRRHRRAYQIVFQDPNAALDPRMTVGQSAREPLDVVGDLSRVDRERRVLTLLERVGLTAEQAGRYPHELSGGQKQRVNIARALTLSPRFLVLDEVVAALDVSIQADMLNLFAELQSEFQLTYLFITHDIGVVTHISDRVAVMYLGRLVELADAATLTRAPLHPYTRALLSAEPEPLPRALRHRTRITLTGEIPSPIDPPSGCRFRTRCPLAAPLCAAEVPAWRNAGQGHAVACHFATINHQGKAA